MAIADLGAKFGFDDAGAAERVERLINVISGLTDKVEGFENVVNGTSKEMGVLSGSINQVGASLTSLYNQKVKKNLEGTVEALDNTRKSIQKMGAQANRFVSSNFMAQFQDIFVSAQMGMRPLTIALQQGTQIMAAFAQSQAPLKDLVAGFKALIGPAALLTVTLTGLAAAGIQMVDWVSVSKTTLNGLAAGFEFVADNIGTFATAIGAVGTTLLIFNAKAVVVTIANLGKLGASAIAAGAKMAAAWLIGMGPVGWIITGILTVTTAFLAFGDEIESFFGVSFGSIIKKAVNLFIGSFIAGFEAVYEGAKWLWDKVLDLFGKGNGLSDSLMDALNKGVDNALHRDYLKIMDDATGNVVSSAADKTMAGLKTGATAVADKLREWSDGLGKAEEKSKKIKDYWADIVRNTEQSIADKKLEGSLLGKSDLTQNYEKTLQSLIQQAEDRDIDLYGDDKKIDKLKELAEGYAEITVEVDNLTEAYNDGKSIFKGFFTDMVDGLKKGESAWKSFGNAVLNVLNKIQEKLMDKTTDLLFDALWNVGSAYFGSTTTGSTDFGSAEFAQSVGRKPVMAANGGVFSNGVYDSPTLFKFARGGRFGVMGEAGPEAVMPLTRGPDGSLGVKAESAGSSPVIVNIINNSNAQARTEQRQTSQGVELDVMIDNLVADKMSKNGSASNTALKAVSSQSLVMR